MIASRTGRHDVLPDMPAAQTAREHVVNRQISGIVSTVLAGEIIPAQYFALGELDARPRPADHAFQADDRWPRIGAGNRLDNPTPVEDQVGFTGQHQPYRPPRVAHVYGFEIGVKYEYRFLHHRFLNSANYSMGFG